MDAGGGGAGIASHSAGMCGRRVRRGHEQIHIVGRGGCVERRALAGALAAAGGVGGPHAGRAGGGGGGDQEKRRRGPEEACGWEEGWVGGWAREPATERKRPG